MTEPPVAAASSRIDAEPYGLTSQEPPAGFPLTVESHAHGLPKRSWIKVSQIRTLATERLGRRIANASEEGLAQVLEGLYEIIG